MGLKINWFACLAGPYVNKGQLGETRDKEEVQTRESAPDQLQAQAAGIAEGYLTR